MPSIAPGSSRRAGGFRSNLAKGRTHPLRAENYCAVAKLTSHEGRRPTLPSKSV